MFPDEFLYADTMNSCGEASHTCVGIISVVFVSSVSLLLLVVSPVLFSGIYPQFVEFSITSYVHFPVKLSQIPFVYSVLLLHFSGQVTFTHLEAVSLKALFIVSF